MRKLFAPRRGVAMVEFAVTLPVTILLFVGFVQGGLVLSSYVSVTNAAREAARAASLADLSDAERQSAAVQAVFPSSTPNRSTGFALATGTIDNPNGVEVILPAYGYAEQMTYPGRRGQTLTVRVTWRLTMDFFLINTNRDIVATSAMRIE